MPTSILSAGKAAPEPSPPGLSTSCGGRHSSSFFLLEARAKRLVKAFDAEDAEIMEAWRRESASLLTIGSLGPLQLVWRVRGRAASGMGPSASWSAVVAGER